ncbi:MAG: outer membrane beta-barrel protein [Ignavibacteriaceae bacterium]
MKKLLVLIGCISLLSIISIDAQDFANEGIWEVGGGIGFNSTTGVSDGETDDESLTQFWFNPYVGYFVVDGVELGLIPTLSILSQGDASLTSFGILFAPAYNFDLGNCWYPFIEGRVGYNTSTLDPGEGDSHTDSGLEWGFRGGVKAQVGNAALVNAGLFYSQITMNHEDWDGGRNGENVFGIEVGFTVFVNTR